ncbi:MAG: hypothetical protein Q4E72_07125 [bacterium]|nr:hypothetical protein [bacterium]
METVRQYPIEEVTTIQIKSTLSQINVVAGAGKDIVLKWTDTQRRKTEVVLENGRRHFRPDSLTQIVQAAERACCLCNAGGKPFRLIL